ncbi:hypothetical protein F5Y17DRAFT_82547 [Xylariaceae sp. FL0594]|nr:hypothetical protein F5Y17DRAFT_82547 [Xylariaceae sp. FL0594]
MMIEETNLAASLAAPQNIHLRTSCDPCSTAKVRCDKKHPSCGRCIQIMLPCFYSESRKHGRQAWRKRMAHRRMNGMATPAEDQAQLQPQPTDTTNTAMAWERLVVPFSSSSSSLSTVPLAAQTPSTLLQTNHWQGDVAALVSGTTFDDVSGVDMDVNSFGNWDLSQLSPPVLTDGDGLPAGFANPPLVPAQASPASVLSGTSVSVKEPPSVSSSVAGSTHDCEARAISILRSMQHGEMHEGAKSCSTDPVHYTTLNLAPSFDRVLSVNKAALDGWTQLMKCSCALCPHIILLHVSVLSKMIFWYRIAAMNESPTPAHFPRSDSSPGSGSSARDPPKVNQFSVVPTAIQVGTLSLDAEDQANLRRMLLLRELRRVEQAIEELLKVDRSALEEAADEVVHRSVQWSLGGIARVKEELQDVVQRVKQIR